MTAWLKKFSFIGTLKFRSRREKYSVLAALLTVLVFVTFKFGIEPFLESQQRIREEIPIKRKQLEKYRQFVAGKSRAEDALKRAADLESALEEARSEREALLKDLEAKKEELVTMKEKEAEAAGTEEEMANIKRSLAEKEEEILNVRVSTMLYVFSVHYITILIFL